MESMHQSHKRFQRFPDHSQPTSSSERNGHDKRGPRRGKKPETFRFRLTKSLSQSVSQSVFGPGNGGSRGTCAAVAQAGRQAGRQAGGRQRAAGGGGRREAAGGRRGGKSRRRSEHGAKRKATAEKIPTHQNTNLGESKQPLPSQIAKRPSNLRYT